MISPTAPQRALSAAIHSAAGDHEVVRWPRPIATIPTIAVTSPKTTVACTEVVRSVASLPRKLQPAQSATVVSV